MYRVITIVGGGLLLAACSGSTDWFKMDSWKMDGFKSSPATDTVQFESEPPGAEAKTSTGQSCRTPCSLSLNSEAPVTVTFLLNGYLPETEQVEVIADGGFTRLRPNPVMVELSAAPPSAKKPGTKPAKKPSTKRKPVASAKPAAASQANAPAAAPWPAPKQ